MKAKLNAEPLYLVSSLERAIMTARLVAATDEDIKKMEEKTGENLFGEGGVLDAKFPENLKMYCTTRVML